MKSIPAVFFAVISCALFLSGCASDQSNSSPAAGSGTSGTAQAPGGPGHGPDGAMNGNTP